MKAEIITLTNFMYSEDREGPFTLYVFDARGFHRGGIYFAKVPRYNSEITIERARRIAETAIAAGREVRVTDNGDMLVFHSVGGDVRYPEKGDFWREIAP